MTKTILKNSTIQELRKRANLGPIIAAKELEISLSMLHKIEQGIRKPGREVIKKMSEVYNCSTDEIFLALDVTESDEVI